MSATLNSLKSHNFLSFQPILVTLVSKFMVYRALSDKTYLSFGLRSPLIKVNSVNCNSTGSDVPRRKVTACLCTCISEMTLGCAYWSRTLNRANR